MHLGPDDVLLALSVDFKNSHQAETIEQAVTEIESQIKSRWPSVRRVFLEVQSASGHAALEGRPVVKAQAGH